MVNLHLHHFDARDRVIDAEALLVFQAQWSIYQKLVDSNVLSHAEVGSILHDVITERFAEPFCFLDIACGDASLTKAALVGTRVRHYHGIDLAGPAIELAARNLADEPYEVDLDHRDFVAAMAERDEHADAIWCGLSLHHLATNDKLRVIRGIRDAAGADGVFLLYEPTLESGEDRGSYLDRTWRIIPDRWTSLSPKELEQIWQHIQSSDLPETADTWLDMGREAGFSGATRVFEDPTRLYQMFRYDV